MLTKVDIVLETMSSRSSSRVLSLSTVPSRSSTWPTKSHGPAAMNPVAITARGSSGPEHVAGNLLADEPAEREVGVERARSHSRDTARRGRGACPCRSRACRRNGRRRASAGPTARHNGDWRAADRPAPRRRAGRGSWTNASISSGVGGRPIRSNERRRIKVRRSASGLGLSPCFSSVARMNASIGVRTQSDP